MQGDPINQESRKRYRLVGGALLALVFTACSEPLVGAPTPFAVPDTPLPPTEVAPPPSASDVPVEMTDEPIKPTPIPELNAMPVQEPRLEAGQPVIIRQIAMIDNVLGWAIGEHHDHATSAPIHVLRTTDGGRSWIEVTPPEDPTLMFDLAGSYFEGDHAWIRYAGTDYLWRTMNGGRTWGPVQAGYPMGFKTWFVFTGSQNGWMMQEIESGFGSQLVALFATRDGGDTWSEIINPYETEQLQSCLKTGLSFAGSDSGWVTFDCQGNYVVPFLDISSDGGQNWEETQLPPPPGAPQSTDQGWCYSSAPNLVRGSQGTLIVACVGADGPENSYLYLTDDLGSSWTIRDFPGGEFHWLGDGTVFALGRDQYISRDDGASWTRIKSVNWDGQYSVVDSLTMWAVAVDGEETALVTTADGGQTWQIIEPVIAAD